MLYVKLSCWSEVDCNDCSMAFSSAVKMEALFGRVSKMKLLSNTDTYPTPNLFYFGSIRIDVLAIWMMLLNMAAKICRERHGSPFWVRYASGNMQQLTFAALHEGERGKRAGATRTFFSTSLVMSSSILNPNDRDSPDINFEIVCLVSAKVLNGSESG